MNSFLQLTKVFFLSGFSVNKKKKNQKSVFATIGFFGFIVLAISTLYNFTYMQIFIEDGLPLEQYMLIILVLDTYLTLILSLTQMQGTIFKTKDYEFLESIPVSKSIIVGAKIAAVYLTEIFIDLIITLPAIVFYLVYGGSIYFTIIVFIAAFLVEIVPLLISSIIGALVSLISAKAKHQNLINTIFTLVFSFIPMFIVFLGDGSILDSVNNLFPYFYFLREAIDPSKFYMFLIFIAIHVVSAVIVCYLISLIYQPMNNYLGNIRFHEVYKSTTKDNDLPVDKTLFKKELQMIAKNSKYGINSFLGPVMYLIFGVLFILFPTLIPEESGVEMVNTNYMFGGMTLCFGMIYNSVMSSTPASISFEGKGFELLLAYPIDPKDVIKNKLKVAIVIPTIMNLVAGIILGIIFSICCQFDISMIIAFIVLPIVSCINIAVIGMCCGLRWPKIDYQNEMQLMKNCASVNFTMLFCMLPNSFYAIIVIVLAMFFENAWAGIAFTLICNGISILIGYSILKKHQVNLFNKVTTR